jgi:hypothetical protein
VTWAWQQTVAWTGSMAVGWAMTCRGRGQKGGEGMLPPARRQHMVPACRRTASFIRAAEPTPMKGRRCFPLLDPGGSGGRCSLRLDGTRVHKTANEVLEGSASGSRSSCPVAADRRGFNCVFCVRRVRCGSLPTSSTGSGSKPRSDQLAENRAWCLCHFFRQLQSATQDGPPRVEAGSELLTRSRPSVGWR